ncbi:hypothetical protein BRC89_04640 [Halobacteriales archaeon QS_4_70_19]|nr:MAG: hypothetical protein BRC89_04640 [Halobacteriales archaeon QS_4_70_19]
MRVVADALPVDSDAFLSRPLCRFLAQCSDAGPRGSPLWYPWDPRAATCWMIAPFRDRPRERRG